MKTKLENLTAEKLATEFIKVLRSWLDENTIEEINDRNNEEGGNCCATHDFCDANQAMIEAWKTITGADLYFPADVETDEQDKIVEKQTQLINEAWSIAKERRFTNKK